MPAENMFNKYVPHWSVISRAWSLTWQNRQAWLFGMVAFLADFGGIYETILKAMPVGDQIGSIVEKNFSGAPFLPINFLWSTATNIASAPNASTVILLGVGGVFFLAITVAITAITALAVGALAWIGLRATEKRNAPWRHAIKAAGESIWQLVILLLGAKLIIFAFITLTSHSLNYLLTNGGVLAATIFLLSFFMFVAVGIVTSFIFVFSVFDVMNGGRDLRQSVITAWTSFRRHWISALEVAAMLLATTIVIFTASLLALLIVSVPIIFGIALFSYLKLTVLSHLLIAITGILAVALAAAAAAFCGTIQVFAWSEFWDKVSHRSAVERLFDWIGAKFGR